MGKRIAEVAPGGKLIFEEVPDEQDPDIIVDGSVPENVLIDFYADDDERQQMLKATKERHINELLDGVRNMFLYEYSLIQVAELFTELAKRRAPERLVHAAYLEACTYYSLFHPGEEIPFVHE
ncbi:MAG: hypothetical protein WC289_04105 [Patescibacteria group bacterium]|jgi:hypothetical protein